MNDKELACYKILNKEIFVFGLKAKQLLAIFVTLVFSAVFSLKLTLLIAIPLFILMREVKKENDKGNPDFFESVKASMKKNRVYEDKSRIFKELSSCLKN